MGCSDHTVKSLRKRAKRQDLKGYYKLRKADLCEKLKMTTKSPVADRKKCAKDKILNPKTNRCIKTSGRVYAQLVKQGVIVKGGVSIRVRKHGILINSKRPIEIKEITELISEQLSCNKLQEYKNQKKLGSSHATVYVYCVVLENKKKKCDYAVKIEKCNTSKYSSDRDLLKALEYQNKAAAKGLSPKVYAFRKCGKTTALTVMDAMKGKTLDDYFWEKTITPNMFKQQIALINAVHKLGIRHGDLNPSNFMVTPSGKVLIYDFSYTHRKPKRSRADDWMTAIWYAHRYTHSEYYLLLVEEAMKVVSKSKQQHHQRFIKSYNNILKEYQRLYGHARVDAEIIVYLHDKYDDKPAFLKSFAMDFE